MALWSYATDDPLSAVLAPGYFDMCPANSLRWNGALVGSCHWEIDC